VSDNISKLPVRFKPAPGEEGRTLKIVDNRWSGEECDHHSSHRRNVTYLIRKGEMEVECSACGTRLDPMFVLNLMANAETDWLRTRQLHIEETKRLAERRRTTCQHCGEMTRISRR
jgi:hypothetical protein